MRKLWIAAAGCWEFGGAWRGLRLAKPADEEDVRDRLGERFTSRGGDQFSAADGGRRSSGRRLARTSFATAAADEKWSLNVSMLTFEKPAKLMAWMIRPRRRMKRKPIREFCSRSCSRASAEQSEHGCAAAGCGECGGQMMWG
jgi:hypothetical protein